MDTAFLQLTAFPNPASELLNIRFRYSKGHEPERLYLINSEGLVLKNIAIADPEVPLKLEVATLPKGMHIIRAVGAKGYSEGVKVLLK